MKNCCSCGHRSTRDWLCSHGFYNVGQANHQHGCGACRTTNDTIVCGKVRRVSHRCRRAPLPDPACPRPRLIQLVERGLEDEEDNDLGSAVVHTVVHTLPFSPPPPPPPLPVQPPPSHTRLQPIIRQECQPVTAPLPACKRARAVPRLRSKQAPTM